MSPYPRFEKLAPERREAILRAAFEEFAARGFDEASLNQIIETSGISKGSFYYYFEDKADLFVTVLNDAFDFSEMIETSGVLEAETPAQFWEGIDRMVADGLVIIYDEPELLKLGQAVHQAPTSLRESAGFQAYYAEIGAMMARMLGSGQRVGAIRSDVPVEVMVQLWLAMDAVLDRWMFSQWDAASEEERQRLTGIARDIFTRTFAP